jgi:hypothetical protein
VCYNVLGVLGELCEKAAKTPQKRAKADIDASSLTLQGTAESSRNCAVLYPAVQE